LAPLPTPTLVTKKVIPDDWACAGVDNASKHATIIALERAFAANALYSSLLMLFRGQQQAAATVGQHADVPIIPMRARKSKRRLSLLAWPPATLACASDPIGAGRFTACPSAAGWLEKKPNPAAHWDGDPSLLTPGEAWAFIDGAWKRVNSAVVGMEAALMSKAAFDRKFGSLPLYPTSSG
jgi:hypothetical protein